MTMAEVRIRLRDNGPLVVTGPVELVDAQGQAFEVEDSFALCRCGQSGKKPFCDGTHRTVEFQDQSRAK
ncbi:MAG: CDGSH iron-sulfur domain-containing protein [Kyrpidia tusciae]|nr:MULTISPECIES: CDGSH iron-sulfur domain-containing protein [Kyrpidia]MBE3553350.1 CDGSH iron-sulfur domain-containing protein [Kyrpidia tusciae]